MARSRHSAGILAYRGRAAQLEVLLVHPGGPFWMHRDAGAWTIPKGEYPPEEPAMQAAQREFREETGFAPPEPLWPLTPIRQPGGKWVSAWAGEGPALDPAQLRSNRFTIEWPPRSGVQREFPEVDRAAWFALPEALQRITAAQRALLQELAGRLALAGGGDPQ